MNGYVRTSETISDAMPVQRVRALDKNEGSPSMAAEASEPSRRSTMRLAFPRIKYLQTDDGAAAITFQGVDTSRDTSGQKYVFKFRTPSGDIEAFTTVGAVTGLYAAEKFAAETGNILWDSHPTAMRKYIEKYADEYGHTFEVRIFKVPAKMDDKSIILLRDAFCALFFEYRSSYKYNNSDEASDPARRYPDTINFMPYDLSEKFQVILQARQGGGITVSAPGDRQGVGGGSPLR